jgi:hypothetical protein
MMGDRQKKGPWPMVIVGMVGGACLLVLVGVIWWREEKRLVADENVNEVVEVEEVCAGTLLERAECIFHVDEIPEVRLSVTGEIVKEEYEAAVEMNLDGKMFRGEIKYRGMSSYGAGLKYGAMPYKINLNERVDLLGMGEGKKWLLLPNFLDKSAVRQFLGMGLGQLLMGDRYFVPQVEYVELYLNDEYQGLYLLAESIEPGKGRMDLKGGYVEEDEEIPFLVTMNTAWYPALAWNGGRGNGVSMFAIDDAARDCVEDRMVQTTFSMEWPKLLTDVSASQADYVKRSLADLYAGAQDGKALAELNLDVGSAVDYFLFNDVVYNTAMGKGDVYMYRKAGGKITMGPVWDMDKILLVNVGEGFTRPPTCDNTLYRHLLKNDEFRELLLSRMKWFAQEIVPLIDAAIEGWRENAVLRQAVTQNEEKYQTYGVRYDDLDVYQHEPVVRLGSWDEHLDYIRGVLIDGGIVDGGVVAGRVDWMIEHFDELR